MSDFERTAELSIHVPPSELRGAREDLEDALADIPVGVSGSASSGGAASSGTGGAREQRRRRREFRWARQRTDDVERQVELLENIESELVEGGFGGGPGGMIGDIIGLGGDAAGVAAEGAGAVADIATTAAGTAIGEAAGTVISDRISGSEVGVDADALDVDDPSPLTVEDIDPLEVEDKQPLAVSAPSDIPVEEPNWEITVEKPEWVPLQVGQPRRRAPPSTYPGISTSVNRDEGGGSSGVSRPDAFNRGLRRVPFIGDILGDADRRLRPSAGGELAFPLPGESSTPGNGPGGRPQNVSATAGDVNITVDTNVQSAVQDAIQGLRREQQRQREALRRDLERQISDLESQINSGFGGSSPVRTSGSGPR